MWTVCCVRGLIVRIQGNVRNMKFLFTSTMYAGTEVLLVLCKMIFSTVRSCQVEPV